MKYADSIFELVEQLGALKKRRRTRNRNSSIFRTDDWLS